MPDVYERLAKKLDGLPHGYPATESGVELKILQKIFTPEDAEMALKLKPIPETAESVAERLGRPVTEIRDILDSMAKNRQVGSFKRFGAQMYVLAPFVVGIYEFQVYRLDKELVELFEEYAPTLFKTLGGHEPAIARTVPVNIQVEAKGQIQLYEDIVKMIEEAKSFNLMECICRQERALEGHPCKHPLETCLTFSREENAYDYFSLGGRKISKGEALEVLENAEKEGLVHNTFYNTKQGHFAVCNCCPCCCGVFRGLKEFKAPYALAKSNFVASIDQETCSECGVCAEERCPVEAIVEEESGYTVQAGICIGCGVCTVTCPTESIRLVRKPEGEQNLPPEDFVEWAEKRAANRGIDLKLE
jgi:electron transport complex protein RnfB